MPWHPCVNSRDTITQADGLALLNFVDRLDTDRTVKSYCRDSNGTWIAWTNTIIGDTIGSSSNPDNDPNKSNWPSSIANAFALSVGYFPDDGSAATVYDLSVDPAFDWVSAGAYSAHDPCSNTPPVGQQFSDAQRGEMESWFMDVLDVQVRTDGSNVWVVALAREDVKYPSLAGCGASLVDRCGNIHPSIEDEYLADPFGQDTGDGTSTRFWMNYQGFGGSGQTDDSGMHNSFRWNPARITVFAGDIGGFTRIDTVEAQFNNGIGAGLCGDIEACASPAEPGVCHVVWTEGGSWDSAAAQIGQRINYSTWDFTSKLIDTNLAYATEAAGDSSFTHIIQGGSHYISDANWCWTSEYILRNDHGSPALIILPWDSEAGPSSVEYWDLSSGVAVSVQTLSTDLYVTGAEGGFDGVGSLTAQNGLNTSGLPRTNYASSLYTDPLLADQDVYLLCLGFNEAGLGGRAFAQAVYRIPCDGSETFDFMDGTRLSMYSIIPNGAFVDDFRSDFVSDPGNVWVPSLPSRTGAGVLHLPRTCTRTWEFLPCFPDDTFAVPMGAWRVGSSPPSLITDDAGDWLAGGGYGPLIPQDFSTETNIAALRAKICRCCVPCQERIGLHIWEKV